MPITDATLYVHGSGESPYGPISNNNGVYGDTLCQSGNQYSNLELDLGAGLLSYAEKGYTSPAEMLGGKTSKFGLHILISSSFNLLTSINFQICTSSTSGALVGSAPNPIAGRVLSLAELQLTRAQFFIPVEFASLLEFTRFYAALTGSDPTTGTIIAWFGPMTGGEM